VVIKGLGLNNIVLKGFWVGLEKDELLFRELLKDFNKLGFEMS